MSRWLDPDNDYAYDRTNPPASKSTRDWRNEMIAKAKRCLSFQPQALSADDCETCRGPKFAHSAHALRKKAS